MDFNVFQNCVEQLFDTREVNVSKNGMFAEEFAYNIREWIVELEPRIGKAASSLYHCLTVKTVFY